MISTCSLPATDCEGAGADVSLHLSLFVSPRRIQGFCGLPCKRVVLVVTRHAAAAHPHLLSTSVSETPIAVSSRPRSHLSHISHNFSALRRLSGARPWPCFAFGHSGSRLVLSEYFRIYKLFRVIFSGWLLV